MTQLPDPHAIVDALLERERLLQREHERHARLQRELDQLRAALSRFDDAMRVDAGDLARTTPVSDAWGADRGLPVDRHYIAQFLDRNRADVRGRVLEVKDDGYTHAFGDGHVTRVDVLDVNPSNPRATVIADLAKADAIPGDTYDCVILTQVLGLIPDVRAALVHVHRILKPGGILLCTVPASGRLSYEPPGPSGDYWRFTESSISLLVAAAFPRAFFEVRGFGNVRAAAAFLYGQAHHELTAAELDVVDPFFPIVYAVRAQKPVTPAGAVLMYHRIGDAMLDPHHLSVTAAHFREHLKLLRKHRVPVVALSDLAGSVGRGDIIDRSVAITFDDGYREVLTTAAPILAEFECPATAFVIGRSLDGMRFPWDETAEPLSAAELRNLAAMPGIAIGCHTESHARLPDVAPETRTHEVERCKARLQSLLGVPITSFAYPYGAVDASSEAAVGRAGFACAVTTAPAMVTASANVLQLPRLEIRDCDGDGFAATLERYGLID